jgi:hypothetical protein
VITLSVDSKLPRHRAAITMPLSLYSASMYDIYFDYYLERSGDAVRLQASVIREESDKSYIVRDIRPIHRSHGSIIPDVQLKRKNGYWVHIDSEKETDLSIAIGKAIDTTTLSRSPQSRGI